MEDHSQELLRGAADEVALSQPQFSFWKAQLIGWSLYYVAIYVTFLTVAAEGRFLSLAALKGFRAVIGFALTCGLRLIYRRWLKQRAWKEAMPWAVLASIATGCAWSLLELVYSMLIGQRIDFAAYWPRFPRIALDYTITSMAWSALYLGFHYATSWTAERERRLAAAALAREAQLEMLRYQLNPHFLFNALSSIRASIDEDSTRAKRMVTEFATFLRYSMVNTQSQLTPLSEELEAIEGYLLIEKIRFDEKLQVEWDVAPEARPLLIPRFSAHTLVENAIKHGSAEDGRLRIRLHAERDGDQLKVEVANTGRWSESRKGQSGVGLDNLRARLGHLFPQRSALEVRPDAGWVRVTMTVDTATDRSLVCAP